MLLTLLTTKSCNCFWRASVHIDRCLPVVYINQRRNSLTRSRAFNSSPSVRLQPDSVEQFILQHFRWQSLCGLELMAIALQASHTHTYTHIVCTSMATSNILNHASKSFQKLLIAASPTNSICQAWRVRSLSVWLIHLQFQSKQTNNLTTYIHMYIHLCT